MHGRYEEWIDQFNACPVLRLNINDYDLMQDEASIEPLIKRISEYMEQTKLLRNM